MPPDLAWRWFPRLGFRELAAHWTPCSTDCDRYASPEIWRRSHDNRHALCFRAVRSPRISQSALGWSSPGEFFQSLGGARKAARGENRTPYRLARFHDWRGEGVDGWATRQKTAATTSRGLEAPKPWSQRRWGGPWSAERARQPAGLRRRSPGSVSPVRDLGAGIAMHPLQAAKFSRCAKLDHLDVTIWNTSAILGVSTPYGRRPK